MLIKKQQNVLFILLLWSAFIYGQGYLGPGGVGNTDGTSILRFWYDANNESYTNLERVNNVTDKSGYSNTLTAADAKRPTFTNVTADANNMSSFVFDGGGVLETSYNGNSNENMSFFTVLNYTSDANLNIAMQHGGRNTIGFSADHKYMDYVGGSNHTSSSVATGNWELHSKTFENTGTNRLNYFVNNSNVGEFEHTIENKTSNTYIGGKGIEGGGEYFKGSIAEVIKYTTTVNTAQRIIIDNYLSAKYNITLASNDFYNADTTGENFDYNVAGIGQASDGANHTDSQGTGIIRINTPLDLDNDEFLFWGEDLKDASYDFLSSSDTNFIERLDTKWRVSKAGDLGAVSFSLQASDIDLNGFNCGDLNLIVSNSSSFTEKTTYPLTLNDGIYSELNLTFNDGDYFTLEYSDLIVVDDAKFYNGSGTENAPNITDDCYKLLVKSNANGTLTLTENTNVREIEVEAGGILTVDSGYRLKVTNGINNNGEIRLLGASQLIQTHTTATNLNTGSGSLYKDQNSDLTSVYRYNYWSSPVKEIGSSQYTVKGVMKDGTTITSANSNPLDITFTTGYDGLTSPLTLSSYWIYGYLNGTDGSNWSQKGELGTFNPGEGYLLKSPGAYQNYTFKGTPNDGDITFYVDANKTSLLGNPYPSAIDANQLFADSPNLATIYFWEHKNELSTYGNEGHYQSSYIGGYSYRNATMGIAADYNVSGTEGLGGETYTSPGQYIPVGQGFFVETGNDLAATINFKNNQRIFVTEAGDSHFFKTDSKQKNTNGYPILKFGFEAKNSEGIYIHSQVGISFSEGKTYHSEVGFDSKKAEIKDSDIYFQFEEGSDKLVIAGIQTITEDLLVPLTLKVGNSEEIFLMLDEQQNFDKEVYIFDAVKNIYYETKKPIRINLAQNIYSNRFYITFRNETLSIVEALFNKNFTIYQNNHIQELAVKNINNKNIKQISVHTLTGKKIIELTDNEILKRNEIKFKTNNISTSIYILNITTSEDIISKKIFIE